MEIQVLHADPVRDSELISNLINICIAEKRTVLSPYTPEEEKTYIKNLAEREAVFVAYVDDIFVGFAGLARARAV